MDYRLSKLTQMLKKDRFASHNNIQLISVGAGEATAEMIVSENHLNGVDIIQGGALFTLADFAAASNSHVRIAVATNASISFYKAVSSGKLTATAREENAGRSLSSYTVDITDETGSKIAQFTVTAFLKAPY